MTRDSSNSADYYFPRRTVATTAFLIYDIITTLDREIRFVWLSKWGYSKAVFLVNRYIPVIYFV